MTAKDKGSSVQRQIDENLKRVYGDVLKQDVPERFSKLLDQLKNANSTEEPPSSQSESEA